jgi:hypothetical protein
MNESWKLRCSLMMRMGERTMQNRIVAATELSLDELYMSQSYIHKKITMNRIVQKTAESCCCCCI